MHLQRALCRGLLLDDRCGQSIVRCPVLCCRMVSMLMSFSSIASPSLLLLSSCPLQRKALRRAEAGVGGTREGGGGKQISGRNSRGFVVEIVVSLFLWIAMAVYFAVLVMSSTPFS